MGDNRDYIAANIKKYREQLGLTQKEFAEKIYFNRIKIMKWEGGDGAKHRYERLPDLLIHGMAEALGVSVSDLFRSEHETDEDRTSRHIMQRIEELNLTKLEQYRLFNVNHSTEFFDIICHPFTGDRLSMIADKLGTTTDYLMRNDE